MRVPLEDFQAVWKSRYGDARIGHDHFWERGLTRRQLVGRAAGAAGVLATSSVWFPAVAQAKRTAPALPRPVPGGTTIDGAGLKHFYFPTDNPFSTQTVANGGGDPSTITDFNGFVGVGDFTGGTGKDGSGVGMFWNADLRFMSGEFIGTDGKHHHGAFAFV
jgi:hypothetical protein